MGSDGEGSQVTLQIKLASDRSTKSVQIDLCQTVEEFKLLLAHLTGIPSDQQILVYMGRYLDNSRKLENYEMKPDQIVHLVQCSEKNIPPLNRTYGPDGISGSDRKLQSALTVDMLEPTTCSDTMVGEDNEVDILQLFRDICPDQMALIDTIEFGQAIDFDEMVDESLWHENHKVNTENLVGEAFDDVSCVRDNMQEGVLFGCATAAVCGCNSTSLYHSFSRKNGLDGNDNKASEKMTFASKLAIMEQMGLKDRNKNIKALLESREDVEMAVLLLLDNPNPDEEERS